MLTQQLKADLTDVSGVLIITASAGALAELQGLAQELALRENVQTDGEIHVLSNDVPPIGG